MKRPRRPVLFTSVKKSELRLDRAFRDAPVIPEQAGRMMDRVMGGKGRGMDQEFEPCRSDHLITPKGPTTAGKQKLVPENEVDVDENDVYAKLGWNDDFDL